MRNRQLYYICRRCSCNYDSGELIDGICIDCIEKERERSGQKKGMMQSGSEKNEFLDIVTRARIKHCVKK